MRTAIDLPPFVHRKKAKGKTYYYFALASGGDGRLIRLPDILDPSFKPTIAELYERRPPRTGEGGIKRLGDRKVYFIGGPSGPIKIGMSRDPEARCRDMKVGAPTDYQVLATVVGGTDLERAYHARFEYAHIRGEWFERVPDLLAEISRLGQKGAIARK